MTVRTIELPGNRALRLCRIDHATGDGDTASLVALWSSWSSDPPFPPANAVVVPVEAVGELVAALEEVAG